MVIVEGELDKPDVVALLRAHLENMQSISPPESTHALDLSGLQGAEITFWTLRDGPDLMGCGALKELSPDQGEIKSMRTVAAHLRKGVAAKLLEHIIGVARDRGYRNVSLETGSMEEFKPAHRLYERHGFSFCGPFGPYREDPNSVFMELVLA